jgi:hypothetical protein
MHKTGIDFILGEYIDYLLADDALCCLVVNRPEIVKHLRDSSLYYMTNLFVNNYMDRCVSRSPKLIIELAIILDIFVNNTYFNLINPDDTNFQLFSIIMSSQLADNLLTKLKEILVNREPDEPDEKYYLDNTLNKFSNNIVKELGNRDINVDVYTENLRIDLNKIIISLLK